MLVQEIAQNLKCTTQKTIFLHKNQLSSRYCDGSGISLVGMGTPVRELNADARNCSESQVHDTENNIFT